MPDVAKKASKKRIFFMKIGLGGKGIIHTEQSGGFI
jgi:hypothetical protein